MDHNQAIQQMAAERYLLDELEPQAREAFEEHVFGCSDCALDLRSGVVFIEQAKAQLPELAKPQPVPARPEAVRSKPKRDRWLAWWRPVFVAPAFAALLLALGYQNLVTFPALRASLEQPRIVPVTSVHGATRGDAHQSITADRKVGVALALDLPEAPGAGSFVAYSYELYDPTQKLVWSRVAVAPAITGNGEPAVTLDLPGVMLREGSYKVVVSGVGPRGDRSAIETYALNIHLAD